VSARRRPGPAEPFRLGEQLDPVYLLWGDEDLLVRQAVDLVAERALQGGPAAFNRAEGSAGVDGVVSGLLSQARTPPMMGPRRLVVIREMENAKVRDLDALLEYCASPVPSTVLLMCGRKLPAAEGGKDRGARLRNLVRKQGCMERFRAEQQDPVAFVRARCTAAGCQIGGRQARALVEVVGRDLGQLAGEIDKLVAYVGGSGRIGTEHVEAVCSLLADAVVFDLSDAIVRGQAGLALAIAHRLLEEGHAPARVMPLVCWQVRQLLLLQDCLRRGSSPYDEGIRMPRAKLDAARASLRRHPLRAERVLEILAASTQAMRSNRAGERRVFESLVLQLAMR